MNLPCLNPSCKSKGRPHPNCHCYGLAEGGSVERFCASDKAHNPSCQYFAKGGQVAFNSSPQESAVAALAHSGAKMLFGSPKNPYFGAFGSGTANSKLAGGPLEANLAQYQSRVTKGQKAIDSGVRSLFDSSVKHDVEPLSERDSQNIKDYIDKGGSSQELQDFSNQPSPMFAEGGQVNPKVEDPLSSAIPEHSMALNTAKSRTSGYLNSLKPQDIQQRRPFDPKDSQKVQNKAYDKAIEIAGQPLTVLKEIKEGRISPDSVKHLSSMYPELKDHLEKKMTGEITKMQLEGKRPSYRVRQGLSLLMGTELDSTMTPQSIMAVQGTFAPQAPAQQSATSGKNKKSTSSLSEASDQYRTRDQSTATRENK